MKGTLRKRFDHKGRAGFSLIELIFAMVFLAIGLLGVATVFPLGTRFVNSAKINTTAVALSKEKLEELQASPSGSASLVQGSYSDSTGVYTRNWTVVDGTPMAGMKGLTVSTSWETSKGTRDVVLETYIFR